jgi:hypothetical protein
MSERIRGVYFNALQAVSDFAALSFAEHEGAADLQQAMVAGFRQALPPGGEGYTVENSEDEYAELGIVYCDEAGRRVLLQLAHYNDSSNPGAYLWLDGVATVDDGQVHIVRLGLLGFNDGERRVTDSYIARTPGYYGMHHRKLEVGQFHPSMIWRRAPVEPGRVAEWRVSAMAIISSGTIDAVLTGQYANPDNAVKRMHYFGRSEYRPTDN